MGNPTQLGDQKGEKGETRRGERAGTGSTGKYREVQGERDEKGKRIQEMETWGMEWCGTRTGAHRKNK
jgi:hypothetical protein